jgi:stage IV sporulation protein FB
MLRFSLLKIPVSIHWMFWLLAAFLGGAFYAQTPEQWQRVVVFMLAAFFSILIHELGHALVGLRLGAPRVQIMLHGMGGLAQFDGASFKRGPRILMTAAGPGASIALALIFLFLGKFIPAEAAESSYAWNTTVYFVSVIILINIFWSIINLMPILPLDGGQILLSLLGPSRVKLTCIVSFATIGVLAILLWMMTRSIYNLIIMAFLASHTWRLYQSSDLHES